MAQKVKCLPAMWEIQIRSPGQEDPLEKEIPWKEEPGRLQSMGWQRVGHD